MNNGPSIEYRYQADGTGTCFSTQIHALCGSLQISLAMAYDERGYDTLPAASRLAINGRMGICRKELKRAKHEKAQATDC